MLLALLVSSCSHLEIIQDISKDYTPDIWSWLQMNKIFKPGKKERICLLKMRKKKKKKRQKVKEDVLKKGNGCVQISTTALLPAYPEMGDAETGTFR